VLRTSNELVRYAVEATDGSIGSVKDLLFDDRTWMVRSIVVDTGKFLCHHEVLIEPGNVRDLEFPEETMLLNLAKQDVENAPGLDSSPPVSQQSLGDARDVHLRSSNETCTYKIEALDAAMGQVHGFVIETATWSIRYLIVDTGEWLGGKLTLVGPHVIRWIDWSSGTMQAGMTADAIRSSPEYDECAELSRDYEAFLHDYYGWPPYWQ